MTILNFPKFATHFPRALILTSLLPLATLTCWGQSSSDARAEARADSVLVEMNAAFKKLDKKRLTDLLPQAAGHSLEPWAA
jgi:soluble lytic murein transglycosylase